MRRIILGIAVPVTMMLAVGCKSPVDPDGKVDTSVPPPVSANEPAGFTPIANRGFAKLDEDHWIWGGQEDAWKVMEDNAAPQSRPTIGRVTIPVGFNSGASPIHLERNIRDNDYFYVNFWFRLSENWEQNQINDMAIALWAGDEPRLYWGWRSDSTGTMRAAALVSTDKVEGGSLWLDPNLGAKGEIKRNQWQHLELVVQSIAGASGRYVAWLDGVKIASYENVPFNTIETGRKWDLVQVGPSWGGLTDPIDQTQWIDFDHLYMSAPK